MSTELALPAGFGAPSAVFGNTGTNDELGAGIASSYGVIGYKGKVWSTRFGGVETVMMREDGDGPKNSVEVIIVKAAAPVSKIFYKGGYVDGSTSAPDCWSANGVTPDASVQAKVNQTCADCPMNAWGSRVTESGKPGKQCADSRRIAVVPSADIDNELFGGPMLLRVPAASLKDLKAYGDLLNSYQYPYYACVTRISFDPKEAYPKFVFGAVRPLTDAEAHKVLALRDDKRVSTVLNETADQRVAGPVANKPPASPFEEDGDTPPAKLSDQAKAKGPAAPDPAAAAKKAAIAEKKRAAAAALAEATRLAAEAESDGEDDDETIIQKMDEMDGEDTSEGNSSFDEMLDKLL